MRSYGMEVNNDGIPIEIITSSAENYLVFRFSRSWHEGFTVVDESFTKCFNLSGLTFVRSFIACLSSTECSWFASWLTTVCHIWVFSRYGLWAKLGRRAKGNRFLWRPQGWGPHLFKVKAFRRLSIASTRNCAVLSSDRCMSRVNRVDVFF